MVIVLTVLNVLLLIGSIVCTVLTYRNNKIINSTETTFVYREEDGGCCSLFRTKKKSGYSLKVKA